MRMTKRKNPGSDDLDGDQSAPLPIQLFFWRQTSPFIRPKLGKLCDASCVSFERVVVQNINHGLSPSLCDAIDSVSRWKIVQTAFPHVLHACSALLNERKQSDPDRKFTSSEIKLLYTLHWIVMDSASECADADTERYSLTQKANPNLYLHSLPVIQLFVYLFVPLINSLKDSDFQSLKLESGLRLWQPLWDYRQPDIPCFSTPVKPLRNVLKAQRNRLKVNTNAANIYIGKGCSTENIYLGADLCSPASLTEPSSPLAPIARMSDICPTVSDAQSIIVDMLCEFCYLPLSSRNSNVEICKCHRRESFSVPCEMQTSYNMNAKASSPIDDEYMKQRLASVAASGIGQSNETSPDVLSASCFDIGVLRCLFCIDWCEDGVYWALRYIHQRLLEIADEFKQADISLRERSKSLPIPDIQVSPCPVQPLNPALFKDLPLDDNLFYDVLENVSPTSDDSESTTAEFLRLRKEPPYKRVRVLDHNMPYLQVKQTLTDKNEDHNICDVSSTINQIVASKQESCESSTNEIAIADSSSSFTETDTDGTLNSASNIDINSEANLLKPDDEDDHNVERRKSMPALRRVEDAQEIETVVVPPPRPNSTSRVESLPINIDKPTDSIPRPIITITEHSPESSPRTDVVNIVHKHGSFSSERSVGFPKHAVNIARSLTDSKIIYNHEKDIQEISGSLHYIQPNGHVNYNVVLQAVHLISFKNNSSRVCEVLMNLLNCLLDLDIVNKSSDAKEADEKMKKMGDEEGMPTLPDVKILKGESTHSIAMDSILRIYKSLGCPHGCGEGVHGMQGDHLRHQGQSCMHRLQRINPQGFREFLHTFVKKKPIQELMDFLHAFLGFCVDPNAFLATNTSYSPQNHRKTSSLEGLNRNGFHNNFGHSIGGIGYRGVEGVLISNLLKVFVTQCVESKKELNAHENATLLCDVKQFISYVKEVHGGTFRRVSLSGLLDPALVLREKEQKRIQLLKQKQAKVNGSCAQKQTHAASVTSESGDENGPRSPSCDDSSSKSRKSLFKKKTKKVIQQLVLNQAVATSDPEGADESESLPSAAKSNTRANLNSNGVTEEEGNSVTSTPKRRFSKFQIGRRRVKNSDHEDDAGSDPPVSPSPVSDGKTDGVNPSKKKMSFKAAGQATLSFLSARRKIEDVKMPGKKAARHSSNEDLSKQGIFDHDDKCAVGTVVYEKKLVNRYLIKSGMLRFSFILECCNPGSYPDPQLIAAMLDLEAPVVARASLLVECAFFIHRCNRGDWPTWMKLNMPMFRHSMGRGSSCQRTHNIQKLAGRMFYSWAEHLGNQLEYILGKEAADRAANVSDKPTCQGHEEHDDDFLDEASVNPGGSDCPYALKMLSCLVLQEITTFLRETYQYLPHAKTSRREYPSVWEQRERSVSASRRWSAAVGSSGPSDRSTESIGDLATVGSPSDRKISFVVMSHVERSDSVHSSTTSLSMSTDPDPSKARRHGQSSGKQKLLNLKYYRRGSGNNSSFRHNRSFKLKRGDSGSVKHFGSTKSRKVSTQSLRSDDVRTDDEHCGDDSESVLVTGDEGIESPGDIPEEEEPNLSQILPWVRVVVQLANKSNFTCSHQERCHENCYERQRRGCSHLISAIHRVYHSTQDDAQHQQEEDETQKGDGKKETFRDKMKRRESIFQHASPTKRRESTPLLEKMKTDVSAAMKMKSSHLVKKALADAKPRVKDDPAILKYLTNKAQKLIQCPLAIMTKAAPVLPPDIFMDILPVAWELLLETDQELAAASAAVFLLSAVKCSDKAQEMITRELEHETSNQRINALSRFSVLWRSRFQVWSRMEEGASLFFKVPPPGIDFTLPSPTIGLPTLTVIDPPWMPHFKAKIEEVTVNQEETKSLVTATTTRRKQQQEMIHKALLAEEERKRIGREQFPMMTINIQQHAAYEPALHHVGEEHEEVAIQEEINLATRRVSLAPVNRANLQSRSMSWRNGSMHWGKITSEGDEDRAEHIHHMQLAQSFFPSCMCATVIPILHLLDDSDIGSDGISVAEVAQKTIWMCVVDDPGLFLRHFLEKLTSRDKQEELMLLLRKLLLHQRDLPAQISHSIFNYLIGYVMFYVRSPCEGGQEAIGGALNLLVQVVSSVEGIYFKDLKQTLKKEQCDPFLMVSANVASAKKIIIHGPDLSSIPSQLPIHEDTQFSQILQDSLDFFNIPDDQHDCHFIVDTKSYQMHNLNSYVRDFYFFRRSFYPQLSLVYMNPEDAITALHKQAFVLKFVEIGKVLFTNAILECTPSHQRQNHVVFLMEEFIKLPSFPRKALEAEFGMYQGDYGHELFSLDALHKFAWIKLMGALLGSMSNTLTRSLDLPLFLNVISGAIVLHAEDTAILRHCIAILINAATHFKHIFAVNGYMYVMPTLLQVFSNNEPNTVLCKAIMFVCKQFYILHRKPFILQMFGSISPIIDLEADIADTIDTSKIQPDRLFRLLLDLEHECPDALDVLEFVEAETPLKALDFCYEGDSESLTMIDLINMCVTVVAYAADSQRATEMLTILQVVIPRYLTWLRAETTRQDNPTSARFEINQITSMATSVRALIMCCEVLTRNMSIPQRHLDLINPNSKPTHNHHNHSPQAHSVYFDEREDSHASRLMEEGRKRQYASEDAQLSKEFRQPRDRLMTIASQFFSTCLPRLREIRRILSDPGYRPPEIFDFRTHNRLADIAHTLLKVSPYDPLTMSCSGLQQYMMYVLPITDWSQEPVRPALNLILRRLDRLFGKIAKKQNLRRKVDWEAAANILTGVYATLRKFVFVAHLPHLKTLINMLLSIILSWSGPPFPESAGNTSQRTDAMTLPPLNFCHIVVKLAAMQMHALGDQYSLEYICGGMSQFPTHERCLNMLINFVLPLCIQMGSGCRDTPKLREADMSFALTLVLNALNPPFKAQPHSTSLSTKSSHHLSLSDQARSNSMSQSDKSVSKTGVPDLVIQTAYLGLEILMVCFDTQLTLEWHRAARCIKDVAAQQKGGLALWKFIDFVVTHRPATFLLLQPFIIFKMLKANCDTAEEHFLQQTIKDKIHGDVFSPPHCKATILTQLTAELKQAKEELVSSGISVYGDIRPRTATMGTERSEHSQMFSDQHRNRTTSFCDSQADPSSSRPTLATIGKRPSKGTIQSQTSSTGSTSAVRTGSNPTTSVDSHLASLIRRHSSKRIVAVEGSCILENLTKKLSDTGGDDDGSAEEVSSHIGHKITASFKVKDGLRKQVSAEEPTTPSRMSYENEEAGSKRQNASLVNIDKNAEEQNSDDSPPHRLQRQDAKSRKTFKIRRQKTKTATVRRFMSRKGRYGPTDATDTAEISALRMLSEVPSSRQNGKCDTAQTIARSVETIPESTDVKPSRPRYIPRSKSHDDPSHDLHAPVGTARGRIARQGARYAARSPSNSPTRKPLSPPITSPPTPPTPPVSSVAASGQTYGTRSESQESLPTNENSALLSEEDIRPKHPLCIYFADMPDTIV